MRVFAYEHVTGGGFAGREIPKPLASEGGAMLRSIASDLVRLPGVSVTTVCDSRLGAAMKMDGVETLEVRDDHEASGLFDRLARECDGVLVIAPELGRDLEKLSRRVLDAGGRLLGSPPEAIGRASDKLLLPGLLRELNIPCVEAEPFAPGRAPSFGFPAVIKPRYGAGSTETSLVQGTGDLPHPTCECVATPYVHGLAASMLLIAGPRGILALRAGEQLLSRDGSFRYEGGRLPLSSRLEARARRLALRAVNSVPGLLGFAGVDLILDPREQDDTDDRVIEINARLTTSYVGLRALAEANLAEHWLRCIHGEFPAAPHWRNARVQFRPDGLVELEENPS